jgi:hypothetical protein
MSKDEATEESDLPKVTREVLNESIIIKVNAENTGWHAVVILLVLVNASVAAS